LLQSFACNGQWQRIPPRSVSQFGDDGYDHYRPGVAGELANAMEQLASENAAARNGEADVRIPRRTATAADMPESSGDYWENLKTAQIVEINQ
jgi:hypothetical protein